MGDRVVLLAAANPLTLRALDIGHPEELLGAALASAPCSPRCGAPLPGRVLLGLALANKAWAVLAIGPVLSRSTEPSLARARHRRRHRRGLPDSVPAGRLGSRSGVSEAAAQTDAILQPWQLWWPLGEHGHVVRGFYGVAKADWRAAPAWIGPLTHPFIALLVVPLSLLWRRRHGDAGGSVDVLLLLALLFLCRCVLDPANNVYYHLPFVIALLAWEALAARGRRSSRPSRCASSG